MIKLDRKTFSQTLYRWLLAINGADVRKLADKIDVSFQAIYSLHHGGKYPSMETIFKICNYYEILPSQLMAQLEDLLNAG